MRCTVPTLFDILDFSTISQWQMAAIQFIQHVAKVKRFSYSLTKQSGHDEWSLNMQWCVGARSGSSSMSETATLLKTLCTKGSWVYRPLCNIQIVQLCVQKQLVNDWNQRGMDRFGQANRKAKDGQVTQYDSSNDFSLNKKPLNVEVNGLELQTMRSCLTPICKEEGYNTRWGYDGHSITKTGQLISEGLNSQFHFGYWYAN